MRISHHYLAALVMGATGFALPTNGQEDPSRDALIVETILRIEGFDLSGSTKAQGAVKRYLKDNWGGERYLDLIERFDLKEEAPGLLRLALIGRLSAGVVTAEKKLSNLEPTLPKTTKSNKIMRRSASPLSPTCNFIGRVLPK